MTFSVDRRRGLLRIKYINVNSHAEIYRKFHCEIHFVNLLKYIKISDFRRAIDKRVFVYYNYNIMFLYIKLLLFNNEFRVILWSAKNAEII